MPCWKPLSLLPEMAMPDALPLDPTAPLSGRWRIVGGAVLVPPKGPERPQPCGVFDAAGGFVTESLCFGGSASLPVTCAPESAAPVQELPGLWLFGGVISGHFGHMLCEATGRLWALSGQEVAGVVFFARPFDKVRQVQKAFSQLAELLGLPPVLVLDAPARAERLLLAEQGLGSSELLKGRPEARAFLRDRLAPVAPEGAGRRFYITRSGQPARRGRVLDEEGLEALFAAAGYEVIRPEDFKLARQVAMFRAASHVVATEGSPLHLLSFAAPTGCQVAVIQRRRSPTFGQICDSLRWFLGTAPLRLTEIASVHAPKKTRNANFIYLEPSRPALRAGLIAGGFLAADTPDWPDLTAEARAEAVARLAAETEQRLRPVAVEDLPEDDGDEERDAA